MIRRFMAVLILLMITGPRAGDPLSSERFNVDIERVSDRVVVARLATGSNVTAIETGDGIVIVDTHLSPGTMEVLRAAIACELGRDDVVYVVNTHGHWDHCSGNQVFPDATIVGHVSTPAYIFSHPADSPRILLRQRSLLERERKKGDMELVAIRELILYDLENRYKATPPSQLFEERFELVPGDNGIQLAYCGVLHTITDIVVYVAGDRVLLTGDLFPSPQNFGFSVGPLSDVPKLLETIQFFLDRGVDVVIPGHGETMTGDDLARLYRRLSERYAETTGRRSAAYFLREQIKQHGIEYAMEKFRNNPDDPSFGERSLDEFYLLGNLLLDEGNAKEARAVFELILDLYPEDLMNYMIWAQLGDVCLACGDTLSAISAFDRVLELKPGHDYADFMLETLSGQ